MDRFNNNYYSELTDDEIAVVRQQMKIFEEDEDGDFMEREITDEEIRQKVKKINNTYSNLYEMRFGD